MFVPGNKEGIELKPVCYRKTLIWVISIIAIVGLMFSALSFYWLQDRNLTSKVLLRLEKALKPID